MIWRVFGLRQGDSDPAEHWEITRDKCKTLPCHVESEGSALTITPKHAGIPSNKPPLSWSLHRGILWYSGLRSKIEATCRAMGYEPVVICMPEELMED